MAIGQRSGFQEVDQCQFLRKSLSDGVGLVPYAFVSGPAAGGWTVSDEIVLKFAEQAILEGTFDQVFAAGRITGAKSFLLAMQQPANVPVFFFVGKEPIGVACLNGCQENRAFGHFLFLSKAWGKYTEQAGRIALDYWFSFRVEDQQLFDVIMGVIPSENTRAIDYVQRIGFSVLGEIPKMVAGEAATIVYMVR